MKSMALERNAKPYWLFQAVGWIVFASFNFGIRLSIFPDVPSRSLEIFRTVFALLATFPLRKACRTLWQKGSSIPAGVSSCLLLAALLATSGEGLAELLCHAIWNRPREFNAGFLVAESTHFFVTLCCWCALYFTVRAYFEAEEQAQQAMASLLVQREVELELLRYQIQPEFFSIGLDQIRSLIMAGDTKQASIATSQFGGLLRSMLDEKDVRIADLASELVHARDYLRVAFNQEESQLEVELDLALEPNQILIPRWLLIPLVEATLNTFETIGRLKIRDAGNELQLQLHVSKSVTRSSQAFGGIE